MNFVVIFLAGLGLAISTYAYFVELKIKKNPEHKPACDISEKISCSKPIKSSYGSLLGISNSLVGIFFYLIIIDLSLANLKQLLFWATAGACAASMFLAYTLFFKIRSMCLICIALYVVNFALLVSATYLYFR